MSPTLPVIASKRFRFEDVPDLSGRVALVLGGSAGIGYSCALALALANAKVIIASSTEEHGQEALLKIRQAIVERNASSSSTTGGGTGATGSQTGQGSVEFEQVNLDSIAETRALAQKIKDTQERLDIFIANAAIASTPFTLTKDGLGNHFQVNNLSQFILINELLPLMERTAETAPMFSVRFIAVSSEAHRFAKSNVAFADKYEVSVPDDPNEMYARSKLGNILLVKQLAKRKLGPEHKILAMAVHPGLVATNQEEAIEKSYGKIASLMWTAMRPFMKDTDQGCESSIWAATAPDIGPIGYQGEYFSEPHGKSGTETKQAKDNALGDAFWNLCEQLSAEESPGLRSTNHA